MRRSTLLASLLLALGCGSSDESARFDLVLLGGTVVDGSGGEPYRADVAVLDGRIAAIGELGGAAATETLDVEGLVVAPGFIDVHSHADQGLADPQLKTNRGFVTQGVTTAAFGADGEYSPSSIRELAETFERQGVGTHYLFYVGHNGVRGEVMGLDTGPPSPEQLETMKSLVDQGMAEDAFGLSTGLMYLPGRFATTEEVVALAEVAAGAGGLYDSHVRDPANALLESHGEAIRIGEESGARPHLAHIKAVGGKNFGTGDALVQLVEDARSRGVEVTADQYPYDGASARQVATLIVPPEDLPVADLLDQIQQPDLATEDFLALAERIVEELRSGLRDPQVRARLKTQTEEPPDGVYSWVDTVGYESFRLVVSERSDWVGRMITEIAAAESTTPFDLLATLVLEEGLGAKVTLGAIQEEDVRLLMKQPWLMIASDGSITGFEAGGGHPRHRGSFPRVLGRYVREWGVLTLEEAVRKMTSFPAEYLGLPERGRIAEGYWADITVFDPERIIDRSTWKDPSLFSEGVVHVLLEGQLALRDEEMTGATLGRRLLRSTANAPGSS